MKSLFTHIQSSMHNRALFSFMLVIFTAFNLSYLSANANNIEEVTYTSLPGNRLQVNIRLTELADKPLSFNIDNPARIAFDFKDTKSKLPKRKQQIGIGVAQSLTAVTVKNKTRVILNLTESVPYEMSVNRDTVSIVLESEASSSSSQTTDGLAQITDISNNTRGKSVDKIDFRRGDKGEGRVLLHLTEANIPMDISEEFGKIVVSFSNTNLPEELHQRLDVLDFATPVKSIDSFELDGNARILIEPTNNDYEHLAYQTDKLFTIEFIPISKDELEEQNKSKFGYTGDRLSLNFQDIPVRAVLQLIADFTGLNVVVSDSVDGNLTLRLKNVPWDQALDIILKAKGLSKRESGNVMLIAPSEEIAAQEKLDLEALQQVTELAPVRSAFFEINFAKVSDLAKLFEGSGEEGKLSLLSPRGSVIMDERTNTLIVKDTDSVISEIRRTLTKLDIPVRQVLIESRIVIATDDFKKELGVRFGATASEINGSDLSASSGTFAATNAMANTDPIDIAAGTITNPIGAERLNVNLPAIGATGSIAFTVLSGGNLLDLELSALEQEEVGEIVSSPRVVTSDRHEAFIEQGVEIPYLSATSSGATQVEFKKAVLSIKVTPQITPDDRIIMDLSVNKDAVGQVFANIPSIDTRQVTTQVLVDNGDTIVLGGIYETETRNELDKVPVLGDLPLIGSMFRHTAETIEKQELLIFVTPKILKDALSL